MGDSDIRMITVGKGKVGMAGLEAVFERLARAGKTPCQELGTELVALAGQQNYVVPAAKAEYAEALVVEYRRYLGEDVPEEGAGLAIKVIGTGCPRCEQLAANVLSALSELGLAADVEHVREPARIAEYGILGTPALVVDGEVKATGKVLSVEEIKKLLA